MCGCAARFPIIAALIPPATPISASRTPAPASTRWCGRAFSPACGSSRRKGWKSSPPEKSPLFPANRSYQIVIEQLEPAGIGALMALLEERRKKFAAEGFFDEARKKKIPFLPSIIGIVTSPTGAVIRDILHRLHDRFPRRVLVWPVRVQGETSAAEVASGDSRFQRPAAGGQDSASRPADRRARRRLARRFVEL